MLRHEDRRGENSLYAPQETAAHRRCCRHSRRRVETWRNWVMAGVGRRIAIRPWLARIADSLEKAMIAAPFRLERWSVTGPSGLTPAFGVLWPKCGSPRRRAVLRGTPVPNSRGGGNQFSPMFFPLPQWVNSYKLSAAWTIYFAPGAMFVPTFRVLPGRTSPPKCRSLTSRRFNL